MVPQFGAIWPYFCRLIIVAVQFTSTVVPVFGTIDTIVAGFAATVW